MTRKHIGLFVPQNFETFSPIERYLAVGGIGLTLSQDADVTRLDSAKLSTAREWKQAIDSSGLDRLLFLGGEVAIPTDIEADLIPIDEGPLWFEATRFESPVPRPVFIPPSIHAPDAEGARAVYTALHRKVPTVFLPLRAPDLDLGAKVSPYTFYPERHPDLALRALHGASYVITYEPLPAIAAAAANVPAILVTRDKGMRARMARFKIPCLDSQNPSLLDAIGTQLKSYPSEAVAQAMGEVRKRSGIPRTRTQRAKFTSEGLSIVTVADANYFPHVIALFENLSTVCEKMPQLYFLALDERAAQMAEHRFGVRVHVVRMDQLWNDKELPRLRERGNGLQAFSSKSRLLAHALRSTDVALYCDCDVYFYRDPNQLVSAFGESSVLMFPHWNDQYIAARHDGLFNAGMIACRQGASRFLEWWGQLNLEKCEIDFERGYVGDQGYLDFAPALFPEVKIYRGGDHNVAKWNLLSLGIRFGAEWETPMLANSTPVSSFHAAFFDDAGFCEIKFGWDQLCMLFTDSAGIAIETVEPFVSNTLHQLRGHWLSLGRFLNLATRLPGVRDRATSPAWFDFFVSGAGRKFLKRVADLRRGENFEVPKRSHLSVHTPPSLWSELQKAQIFGEKTNPTKKRRVRTA